MSKRRSIILSVTVEGLSQAEAALVDVAAQLTQRPLGFAFGAMDRAAAVALTPGQRITAEGDDQRPGSLPALSQMTPHTTATYDTVFEIGLDADWMPGAPKAPARRVGLP